MMRIVAVIAINQQKCLDNGTKNKDCLVAEMLKIKKTASISTFGIGNTLRIIMIDELIRSQIKRRGWVVENNPGYVSDLRMDFR